MRTRLLLSVAAVGLVPMAGGAAAGTVAANSAPGLTTGSGSVFMVNPVQSSGDQTMTDQRDSASAVPESEYVTEDLRNLDGSGYLRGDWVVVQSSTGKAAYSRTGEFFYDRSQDQFEQVMAYFWINQAQEYLQQLGFGDELPGVMDEQIAVKINQYGGDNSYQTDKPFRLRFGKGGVDDAEDAEVIVHEYGHAVHADQVPGFGQSLAAGAIGEGFSDYLAVTVGLDAVGDYGWPVRSETPGEAAQGWDAEACVADWDATSYSQSPTAKCLRRIDQDFTLDTPDLEGVHARGMIWSGALWDIRADYETPSIGLTSGAWDATLIEAQFKFDPDTSFQDAAKATYEQAVENDTQGAAQAVRDRFEERGITFTLD